MVPLRIPRHACSPRDRARAGDLWRLVQEATVLDSAARGWPPARYRAIGSGWVVREMTGVHLREAVYGEELVGYSRVVDSRRDLLMRRASGIAGVLHATAEWVHIGPAGGPARAPRALVDAFPVLAPEAPVTLPTWEEQPALALPALVVRPWWTEMDPMGHVNHPRYVDWADEALSAWIAGRGGDPVGLVPVAERVRFRLPARATDTVRVHTARVGRMPRPEGDAAVFHAHLRRDPPAPNGEDLVCEIWLVRAHLDGPGALA